MWYVATFISVSVCNKFPYLVMKSLELRMHFIRYSPDIVVIFACMLHEVIYLHHANSNKARNVANLHALVKLATSWNEIISIYISKNFAI